MAPIRFQDAETGYSAGETESAEEVLARGNLARFNAYIFAGSLTDTVFPKNRLRSKPPTVAS